MCWRLSLGMARKFRLIYDTFFTTLHLMFLHIIANSKSSPLSKRFYITCKTIWYYFFIHLSSYKFIFFIITI